MVEAGPVVLVVVTGCVTGGPCPPHATAEMESGDDGGRRHGRRRGWAADGRRCGGCHQRWRGLILSSVMQRSGGHT